MRAEPPLVLWVGQLEGGKRPGLFLDLVDGLRAAGAPRFDAAIAGDGPLRGSLEERARAVGVALLGTRTDIPLVLRRAAVLVMTSAPATEGMPGVLVEAGLSGVPAVSTDTAGVADVVLDGETGYVVGGDDLRGFIARVAGLLADPSLRDRLGQAARRHCEARFSVGASAQQWHRLVAGVPLDEGLEPVGTLSCGSTTDDSKRKQ